MKSKKVGFVGLGQMGKGMATNIARHKYDLTVFDISPDPVADLKKEGARAASSCRELAEASDYIISMVQNIPQTKQVVFGKDGLWEGMKAGTTLLISSTLDPQFIRELHAQAAEKKIAVLDAPVSGGARGGAIDGTLSIIVGGEEAVFEDCKPLLDTMGKNIFYMGGSGSGMVTKLVNNSLVYMNIFALIEGLELGTRAGVDEQRLLDVIKVSSGRSQVAENWSKYKTGLFKNIDKDIFQATGLARSFNVKMPVLGLTSQLPLLEFIRRTPPQK